MQIELPQSFADDTFYGLRLDPRTGQLTLEIVSSASDGAIRMPQSSDGVTSPEDYRAWMLSSDTLEFQVRHETGHLEMKVY